MRVTRTRLFSTSDCRTSTSAPQHLLGRLEGAAPAEDREAREEPLLARREEVVRPFDRRAQRALARVGVAAALEQVEPLREALEDLGRRERRRPRGGELHGEREVVEAAAELLDRRSGSSRERRQNSSTASGSASGGTG